MSSNIQNKPDTSLLTNMQDVLHIAFDKHENEMTLMMVFKKENGKDFIANVLKDKEAEEIYKKLVDWGNRY